MRSLCSLHVARRARVSMMRAPTALAVVLIALLTATSAAAQPYDISSWTTVGGARSGCVAGSYALGGTIGQQDANPSRTGGAFTLAGGFWAAGFTGTAPDAADLDSDGLPDAWEQTFGLAAVCDSGTDSASEDPDGDGKTTGEELLDGTHPRGFVTRYLAEGALSEFFNANIAVLNPSETQPAHTLLRVQSETGTETPVPLIVPSFSQRSMAGDSLRAIYTGAFSAIIESDAPVVVDRTMSWDGRGYGSTSETAVAEPSSTWYFAEGATTDPFNLFYLLQNPNDAPVDVTVRYLRDGGASPLTKAYHLPPRTRRTIWVDEEEIPEASGQKPLAYTTVASEIISTAPIVVERAMWWPDGAWHAAHSSGATDQSGARWAIAGGEAGGERGALTYVLVANISDVPAAVKLTLLPESGGPPIVWTTPQAIEAHSRLTVPIDVVFPGATGRFGLIVESLGATPPPIVVERALYWSANGVLWAAGTAATATPVP